MESGRVQREAGLRGTRLTFADEHPQLGLVGRVPRHRPPQISAEALPVQFSLGGTEDMAPPRFDKPILLDLGSDQRETIKDQRERRTVAGKPEAGCKSEELLPSGRGCAPARLRPRLVERGRTGGRRNPDGHTP